jgi:hypothetical protein
MSPEYMLLVTMVQLLFVVNLLKVAINEMVFAPRTFSILERKYRSHSEVCYMVENYSHIPTFSLL